MSSVELRACARGKPSVTAASGARLPFLLAVALAAFLCMFASVPQALAEEPGAADSSAKATSAANASEALKADYLAAVEAYESATERQEQNAQDIANAESEIGRLETELASAQERLRQAAVDMYKHDIRPIELIDMMLSASTLRESIRLYEGYEHVQKHRRQQCESARLECGELKESLTELQAQREEIAAEVSTARQAMDDAKEALRKTKHLDGYKYHQRQGNNKNCGATSFIVGVNVLLGENRFKDNVAVWASDAFGENSTIDIAGKGKAWLKDNKLSDVIDIAAVPGDIHKTDELRGLLEKGGVVVISSGPDSPWKYADSDKPKTGIHRYGHFVCFYGYSKGVYYANDSSAKAKRGAGCPYTEEQMQKWLDGRSYHAACVLTLKD